MNMEELVTLTCWDLIYYGVIAGLFAFVYYDLSQLFVLKVEPWLKKRKERRKEKKKERKQP